MFSIFRYIRGLWLIHCMTTKLPGRRWMLRFVVSTLITTRNGLLFVEGDDDFYRNVVSHASIRWEIRYQRL